MHLHTQCILMVCGKACLKVSHADRACAGVYSALGLWIDGKCLFERASKPSGNWNLFFNTCRMQICSSSKARRAVSVGTVTGNLHFGNSTAQLFKQTNKKFFLFIWWLLLKINNLITILEVPVNHHLCQTMWIYDRNPTRHSEPPCY